ncbi:MAG TPA: helix-turn-helix transcriptional regulator [Phycisphaerales bacterium]|nr:helix-turn-helix transcriptional regulator [Phycisphaerales bacterium]
MTTLMQERPFATGEAQPIGASAIAMLASMPGMRLAAHDMQYGLLWCNEAFARACDPAHPAKPGSTLFDIMPQAAAAARKHHIDRLLAAKSGQGFWQFWLDCRCFTIVRHVETSVFGQPAMLVIMQTPTLPRSTPGQLLCATPALGVFTTMTPTELGVLYCLSRGMRRQAIAKAMHRSTHTVVDHLRAINRKLKVRHFADARAIAMDRGVHCFTPAEWAEVTGAVMPEGAAWEDAE